MIIDAAMNDLIRPTLYDAYHEHHAGCRTGQATLADRDAADVVGPICEIRRPLRRAEAASTRWQPGDLVAFACAGAYGAVMSSTYNTRLPAAEVLVRGDRFDVVRPRPSYDHIIGLDRVPDWLA